MIIATGYKHAHGLRFHIESATRPGTDVDALVAQAITVVGDNFNGSHTFIDIPAELCSNGEVNRIWTEAEGLELLDDGRPYPETVDEPFVFDTTAP